MRRQLGTDSGKTNIHSEDKVSGLEEIDAKKKRKKKARTWKISGAPTGSLGWEHKQYLKARDIGKPSHNPNVSGAQSEGELAESFSASSPISKQNYYCTLSTSQKPAFLLQGKK